MQTHSHLLTAMRRWFALLLLIPSSQHVSAAANPKIITDDMGVSDIGPYGGEVLRKAGYWNLMVGKWHVAGNPFERGFDRHFGFMGGGADFLVGDESFTLDGKPWSVPKENFCATSALTDYAGRFIRDER